MCIYILFFLSPHCDYLYLYLSEAYSIPKDRLEPLDVFTRRTDHSNRRPTSSFIVRFESVLVKSVAASCLDTCQMDVGALVWGYLLVPGPRFCSRQEDPKAPESHDAFKTLRIVLALHSWQ